MHNIPIRSLPESNQEPSLVGSFSIRSLETILDGGDMVEELHRHDFFLMLILIKAKGLHEIDFVPYEVDPNSIFLLRPGQVHKLSLKHGSTGYLVQFKKAYFLTHNKSSKQLLRKVCNQNHYPLNADIFKKLDPILSSILLEYNGKQEEFHEVIKANLSILFIELLRQRESTGANNINAPYQQEKLEKFLELLEENITKYKQVSQYADLLNLTVYQLNAITKALLNQNASQLINEYIILEAKRNLLATSNQVSQIAYHLGYEDVSYFIRFFKKHTGYTPDAYRHNFN
ncbi:AraC family transcriptional regulator [Arenibacter sp. N53]|uniref:helix-turn-helix transcriptional regulator n=1 Tax=Arenibacter TaxID=178469 RepID=UPI000CD474DC|nr:MULTISPECIES: helix-turn-helix transcriptional regulator [Arenibacter]MCM4151045.1 AraC family transcriptional regulator [Arenibacter sp. N53]